MVALAFCISLATGLIYEWYALEMVASLKRRVHYDGGRSPSGSITGLMWESPNARSRGSSLSIVSNNGSSAGGGNASTSATFQAHMHALLASPNGGGTTVSEASSGSASMAAASNNMNSSTLLLSPSGSGGASAMPVSPPLSSTSVGQFSSLDSSPGIGRAGGGRARSRSAMLPRGMIETKDRSFMSGLSRATAAGAFVYFLKFLPWMWGPVVCIFCEFPNNLL
jgi:hypothetical protein